MSKKRKKRKANRARAVVRIAANKGASRVLDRPVYEFDPILKWYAVRTNIKCERRATMGIEAAGLAVYRPTQRIQRLKRGKFIEGDLPAAPRYIFVGLDGLAPQFGAVRSVDGVEGILGVQGTPISIKVGVLEDMDIALARGDKSAASVIAGMLAIVRRGAFAGTKVNVVDVAGKDAIVDMPGIAVKRVTIALDALDEAV